MQGDEGMEKRILDLQPRRLNLSKQEWAQCVKRCLNCSLQNLVYQGPLTHRTFIKPRGYSGDAELIDYIYVREER